MQTLPVERVRIAGAEDLARHLARKRPVVIAGGLGEESPLRGWTPEHLRDVAAETPVAVSRFADGVAAQFERVDRGEAVFETLPLADVMDRAGAGAEALQVLSMPLADVPALHRALEVPECLQARDLPAYLFWGPAGHVTFLHYDFAHALLVHLHGRKRVVLFDPSHYLCMYPRSLWHTPSLSRVWLDAPDLGRFPRFRKAVARECALEPGDLLLVPSGCWHQAQAVTESVSLSLQWRPAMSYVWTTLPTLRYALVHLGRRLRRAAGAR